MNFPCLARNVQNAWLHRTSLMGFLGQLSWPYLPDLPEWFFGKEQVLHFHYPKPIGYLAVKTRAHNRSDVFVFREIFNYQVYKFVLKSVPKTILDLGANVGFASLFFHKHFPQAQIACVEPMPQNVEALHVNLALNQVKAHIFQAAVAIEDGSLHMKVSEWDNAHKAVIMNTTENGKTLLVPTLTIPTICKTLGWSHIDLLKIDIEGYEKILFSADSSWLKQVNALCIEWHDDSQKDTLAHLAKMYGFTELCLIGYRTWLLKRPNF